MAPCCRQQVPREGDKVARIPTGFACLASFVLWKVAECKESRTLARLAYNLQSFPSEFHLILLKELQYIPYRSQHTAFIGRAGRSQFISILCPNGSIVIASTAMSTEFVVNACEYSSAVDTAPPASRRAGLPSSAPWTTQRAKNFFL